MLTEILKRYYELNWTNGDVGLEIEVEGARLPRMETMFWSTHHDGSLRGESAEYVFAAPQPFKNVEPALDELHDRFKKNNSVLDFNYRTSVHVHLNVQRYTIQEIFILAALHFILDDIMVAYAGKDRQGNLFCLRASDAERLPMALIAGAKTHKGPNPHYFRDIGEHVRYSSLNFYAMQKFGSVEWRGLRGTADKVTILEWMSLIEAIDKAVRVFNSPLEVFDAYMEHGNLGFLKKIMPEWYVQWVKDNIPDYDQAMRDGAVYAFELGHAAQWVPAEEHAPRRVQRDAPFDKQVEKLFAKYEANRAAYIAELGGDVLLNEPAVAEPPRRRQQRVQFAVPPAPNLDAAQEAARAAQAANDQLLNEAWQRMVAGQQRAGNAWGGNVAGGGGAARWADFAVAPVINPAPIPVEQGIIDWAEQRRLDLEIQAQMLEDEELEHHRRMGEEF